jgi:phosphatidylglycerophosphatase A
MPMTNLKTRLPPVIVGLGTMIATGLGAGYWPFAPGTAGSLVGLLLYLPLMRLALSWQVPVVLVTFFVGVFCATLVSRRTGQKDPRIVVVDEVLGMWITLLGHSITPWALVVGFFVFRVMDIVKPFPARRLERLPEGWGIVLDDVMAGIYANLILIVLSLWLGAL